MSKREDIEKPDEGAAQPDSAPDIKNQTTNELPLFTSPPTSPSGEAPAANAEPPPIEVIVLPEPPRFRFKMPELPRFRFEIPQLPRLRFDLTRRHKRYALLAATAMLAAGLGAVIGAAASGGFARPAPADVAGQHERKAMQHTIARLAKEISGLKTSIAAANKAGHSQIAKLSDKINDKVAIIDKPAEAAAQPAGPEITGTIPTPRPAPRVAEAESAPAHPQVVKNWSIRAVRDGYVYVQGRGDIYEVVPGAPLPGLGPVQSIKRQDGRWVVTTPKGIIVSLRDRQFFE